MYVKVLVVGKAQKFMYPHQTDSPGLPPHPQYPTAGSRAGNVQQMVKNWPIALAVWCGAECLSKISFMLECVFVSLFRDVHNMCTESLGGT